MVESGSRVTVDVPTTSDGKYRVEVDPQPAAESVEPCERRGPFGMDVAPRVRRRRRRGPGI